MGILLCTLIAWPTPVDIDQYFVCRDKQYKIQQVSKWIPLVDQYFPQSQKEVALLVIYCESRGVIHAYNKNPNAPGQYKGSSDRGLFQINSITDKWLRTKINLPINPYDPHGQMKAASWIVRNVGSWDWWSSSRKCWDYAA